WEHNRQNLPGATCSTPAVVSWARLLGWALCRAWLCSCACSGSTCWATVCATRSTLISASSAVMVRTHRRKDKPPSLVIDRLRVEIATRRGLARVIDDISLEVWPGEIVGVIGESGSGKTMTALSLLGLMPRRAKIAAGEIKFGGEVITHLPDAARRRLRRSRVAFIPQDPLRAPNPVLRAARQV